MAFKFLYLIVLHLVDLTETASLQVTAKWSKVFPDMESAIKVSCTAGFPDSKEEVSKVATKSNIWPHTRVAVSTC